MKASKMMVFRVLKWLSVAIGIILLITVFSTYATSEKTSLVTAATLFVLFAIFFHLEQHKS